MQYGWTPRRLTDEEWSFWERVRKLYTLGTWPNPANHHEAVSALAMADKMMTNMPYNYLPPHLVRENPGFAERYYRPSNKPRKKRKNAKFTWEQALEIRRRYQSAIEDPKSFRASRTNRTGDWSIYKGHNYWTMTQWAERWALNDLALEYDVDEQTIKRVLDYETYSDPEHVPGPPNIKNSQPLHEENFPEISEKLPDEKIKETKSGWIPCGSGIKWTEVPPETETA